MNLILSFFIGMLLLLPPYASSVEVDNLYTAKVEIKDKSASSLNNALKQAMIAVLLKVGGQESILQNSIIKKSLKKYNNYYRQRDYLRESNQNFLVVTFDPSKIKQLFVKADIPLWGSLRPNVIVWLVVENGFSRNILYRVTAPENSHKGLNDVIEGFSQVRGLPFTLPTVTENVQVADIWGRFPNQIINASNSYTLEAAEAAVVLRLSNSSLLPELQKTLDCSLCQKDNFALDWSFLSDINDKNSFVFGERLEGTDQLKLVRQALRAVTQKVYDKYASSTSLKKELVINVANIDTLVEYSQVREFLESLTSVVSVTLIKVNGSQQYFKLDLIGSPTTFIQTLKLSSELQQFEDPLLQSDDALPIFYWRKL